MSSRWMFIVMISPASYIKQQGTYIALLLG